MADLNMCRSDKLIDDRKNEVSLQYCSARTFGGKIVFLWQHTASKGHEIQILSDVKAIVPGAFSTPYTGRILQSSVVQGYQAQFGSRTMQARIRTNELTAPLMRIRVYTDQIHLHLQQQDFGLLIAVFLSMIDSLYDIHQALPISLSNVKSSFRLSVSKRLCRGTCRRNDMRGGTRRYLL